MTSAAASGYRRSMVTARTSETDPIRVGWIVPPKGAPRVGAVGLTFAPGKRGASELGEPWERDLEADLRALVVLGASMLVSLVEDHELAGLLIPDLVAVARSHRLVVERFPIEDGGVPQDLVGVRRLVDLAVDHVNADGTVIIHCRGGLGRAGTIGGCVLVALGHGLEETFAILERARGPSCPENEAQRAFIRAFAEHLRRRPRPATRSGREAFGPSDRRSRFVGAALGAAIGDAMGHPTEFVRSLDEIRARFGPNGVEGYALFDERDGVRFAPYTDDTQMAEAVMRPLLSGLAAGEDLDGVLDRMARAFVAWSVRPQGGHRAPGRACLDGCAALARGVAPREAGGPRAGGCGSVMRAYPFGLVFSDDLARAEQWAVEHSRLTHGDPIALAACAAMAVATAMAVGGAEPAAIARAMVEAAGRHSAGTSAMIADAVAEARDGVPPEVTLGRLEGWAAHEAIAAAAYVFVRHPDDARAAILEAANTIGDSDSIATLVGALVGARLGSHALPADWVRDLERSGALAEMALAAWDVNERVREGLIPDANVP
jgi:ADP-ribosylglycohydrolase/protein-tyrosine phosphatase